MKAKMVTSLLFIIIVCSMVLSSCCSFPYRINTRQVAKKERAEIHLKNAEILYMDGKMVSVNKFLWFLSEHVVITRGKHELIVNYWERSMISKSPKKLTFDAKPGEKYYVQCSKKLAGKASEQKSRDDKYLTKRRGGDYYTDKAGYLYTYECCIKDKATNKTLLCK
jgi:hypothetical protein